MLLNEGDSILIEKPAYTGALAFLRPMNLNFVGNFIFIFFFKKERIELINIIIFKNKFEMSLRFNY